MNMDFNRDVQTYIDFLEIDENVIHHSKVAWEIIEPRMPRLIDDFYAHLYANDLGHYFQGIDTDKLKGVQSAYWHALFAGEFNEAYKAHVDKIGSRHREIGLGIAYYIGSYGWYSERYFNIISSTSPRLPIKIQDLIQSINKIIYLDMIIATKGADAIFID